ncbi:CoA-binding protein [Haematobacter massiliensis]|uniref:CoA-binding protein n=1 Tax=Haematobacter massiliensis TaxID=195105 RepID=A0A086YCS3_9RHOB|nr:CoA-binding protein [Haematobacter massiliensis]KFI32073.1 CoA-binding protein [Haematobacter massiliensis]OWJ72677.1 CoA-binding protein [Haematobacter massiliensis]OWJ86816.1 CoA-binding protein [Haematobacter massiliensis]QBJ24459.1 CoA-binding protein [Haematobacter massiliensis]
MVQSESALFTRILRDTRNVAVIGLSPNPARPSHGVARFLQSLGWRIVPVNPGHAGETILGETVVARLADIADPAAIDMIDIFRRSEAAGAVVEEALVALPNLRTVWMQLGVTAPRAAALARARGVDVVEDRCPAIEFPRLLATR